MDVKMNKWLMIVGHEGTLVLSLPPAIGPTTLGAIAGGTIVVISRLV
jgi:hypothetical protein